MKQERDFFQNWSERMRSMNHDVILSALDDIKKLGEYKKYSYPYVNSIVLNSEIPELLRQSALKYAGNTKELLDLNIELFERVHFHMKNIKKMHHDINNEWGYEDGVYRFYHQSRKVYSLQYSTLKMEETFRMIFPEIPLNPWFLKIIGEGTGREFSMEDNNDWLKTTQPILEAFFHAKYFLDMLYRFGKKPEINFHSMKSGWAGVLYLYNMSDPKKFLIGGILNYCIPDQ